MQISMKAAGGALVSLAFAGTCLACSWGAGFAHADESGASQTASATIAAAADESAEVSAAG